MLLTAFIHKKQAMTKQEFINRVLLIMNEASMADPTGNMFIGADTAKVEIQIEKLYPASWRRCVGVMPKSWFDNKSFANSQKVVDAPNGIGDIVLPDDFLVMTSFKMAKWKMPCLVAQEESPILIAMQSNEYTRGTEHRPVCLLRHKSIPARIGDEIVYQDKKVLSYYSLPKTSHPSTHVVEHALYIPNVTEMPGTIPDDDNIIDPLAYMCASTVFNSFEKYDAAKSMEIKITEMI